MQKKVSSARHTAAEILVNLFQYKVPVKQLFDQRSRRYDLSANDRNLTKQLVYGVLRKKQNLDRILGILSKTPIHKLEPFIHQALAVGLYQIFYLDRIPNSAAVNEAVESCKRHKVPKRLFGFVNGVLRQSIRKKKFLAIEAGKTKKGDPIVNHPDWLVQRWLTNYGAEKTNQICTANGQEPALTLKINTNRVAKDEFESILKAADIQFHQGYYSKDALILLNFHGSPTSIPGFTDGYFQIQDEAAQLVTDLLQPMKKGGCYLDGCAGLGGKTTHLLQMVQQEGLFIHAVEPESYRREKLHVNISRMFPDLNKDHLTVHPVPLQELRPSTFTPFDGILIDAPCSGTGVTGRQPDIRWNRTTDHIMDYKKLQLSLLNHASRLLKPRGILVYATCSIEPEENEEVITAFLTQNKEFKNTDCAQYLPRAAANLVHNGFFRPLPSENIDGFFGARLMKA